MLGEFCTKSDHTRAVSRSSSQKPGCYRLRLALAAGGRSDVCCVRPRVPVCGRPQSDQNGKGKAPEKETIVIPPPYSNVTVTRYASWYKTISHPQLLCGWEMVIFLPKLEVGCSGGLKA